MKINQEILSSIAHLARLEIEPNREEAMMNELSKILTWMEKLNEIDTEQVEPLTHISAEINIFREDEPAPSLDHEKALLNAPKRDANYFRVPKVIE
ncbi:Asp-tRNA(Asn)/Glu-tRNA(Gln) amidotransferase subunit GatC [Raineya orbicola]|jgi:aspartyl-tRNA(Asn)/glutamyl-tRNA(Gln) amidotransferase subunit C|uniref:Aspartyl/glutamyl-tRNA(Asn/Gln) amidotransferase subunit C n=1 Tax=Raineya orbicola TaxID=2016530 RepID=A0A2N3I8R7_9BACT|nr:Asp-tRNA(Asn)/Glu-tRNA(Gln) amidotransferase subunit GatC [Raineya orbicola]PKQ66722.1 gatC: aspartyl/glutamyl-tRNA(Asn/Gln) amidotransferase, C subunit [Raineya orbicola]